MNKIHELDCTLRDGGYCNNWEFGFSNIKKIITSLNYANVDIIECGFLTNKILYNENLTKFTSLTQLQSIIPEKHNGKIYVAMMNYGEFEPKYLPICDNRTLDGIRVAFHKKNINEALECCRIIKEKGYKVFVQPMVSLCYTDEEFLSLIKKTNQLNPYAFYIVDSFGMMKQKDLIRLFCEVEHNLNSQIWIGFHSHNNMQLAYSNAQFLADMQTPRDLIIDSSVFGMGRGAGNLNTELFMSYLNENYNTKYDIKPLLNLIDEVINKFYQKNYWGFSLPNYLSALYNLHPNYAMYLDDKKTLTVESMNEIFSMMDEEKKYEFDKDYIENLYFKYNATGKTFEIHKNEFNDVIRNKEILLIAPGKLSAENQVMVKNYSKNKNVISVGVNFNPEYINTDFIFLSNIRRYKELNKSFYEKTIVTSNIPSDNMYLQIQYQSLLNKYEFVKDNAGLMAINFFLKNNVRSITLAGFNGYSHEISENYVENSMSYVTKNAIMDMMNIEMSKVIMEYKAKTSLKFLTKPIFLRVTDE